jgi:hypothetical protein
MSAQMIEIEAIQHAERSSQEIVQETIAGWTSALSSSI